MKKRVISIVLVMIMLAGVWDMTALAKEPLSEKPMTAQAAYAQFNTSQMYAIANYGIKKQKKSDMLLKVPNNKNGRVRPMIISPADHSTGELFTFAKVGKWYTVTPKCAGSWRLNVEGEKSNTNMDVGLWTNTNHSTQGWYFEPAGGVKDGYIIRSANNPACVLDVRGTTTGKGVKIKKYEANNPCQIWIVRAYAPSISLNKTSATLDIGKTVALSASRRPVNMPVTYSSSAAKVATVNSKGVVTAKMAGTAKIYAKCCGKTAICTVTVRKAPSPVKKAPSSVKKTVSVSKKLNVPYYSQDNKSWNKVKIGKSSSYVGQVKGKPGYGCVLTNVAMIERYVRKNKSITPKTIATEKGEFKKDLFTWKGKKYGKNYTRLKSPGNLANIYKQVAAGKPVIVSVTKKGEGQHWVVIYGYEKVKLDKNKKPSGLKYSNFLIRDPGWASRKKLSVYSGIKNAYVRK